MKDLCKLELLNSMEIVEFSCSCGECEYVLVEDNKVNRELLYKIGLNDELIEKECCPEEGYLDISVVAWKYANWFDGRIKKFNLLPKV